MRHARKWTKEELSMLGKVPDRVVAEQIGFSQGTVFRKRQDLGIPTSMPKCQFTWTKESIALLGKKNSDLDLFRSIASAATSASRRIVVIKPG